MVRPRRGRQLNAEAEPNKPIRRESEANPRRGRQLNAEAEAVLVKILKDLDPSADPQAARTKRQAEDELFIIRHLSAGKKAPEIVSCDLDDKKVRLSDYRGKVVVLDFWLTGCGPCRDMIPHEKEFVKRLADKPFILVSISADREKKILTRFLEKTPMPWGHWYSGFEGVVADWKIQSFPTIYVLDAHGVIRLKDVRGALLDEAVDTLLAEMEMGGAGSDKRTLA